MKRIFLLISLAVLAVSACRPRTGATTSTQFRVEGMSCGHCEETIEKAVGRIDGVAKVEASHEKGRVEVSYDPGQVSPQAIEAAVEKAGYSIQIAGK